MALEFENLPLAKLIRPGGLWLLHHTGFKITLIRKDRKSLLEWGEQPYERPWTKEQFKSEIVDRVFDSNEQFSGIATALGRTHLTDNKGAVLHLNALDIDSLSVYERLESAIEWCKERTWVTRSRRSYGHHIFWLTHEPLPHISKMDMLDQHHLGSFEVKTDKSLGLMTLPPSHHREHTSFQYFQVGKPSFTIMKDDTFFSKLVIALQEFITPDWLYKPEVLELLGKDGREKIKIPKPQPKKKFRISSKRHRVGQIHDLSKEEIDIYIQTLKPFYHKSNRQAIVFYLSGFLHRRFVKIESVQQIVEGLARHDNDRELPTRLKTIESTYSKPREQVTGSLGQLTKLLQSLGVGQEQQRMQELEV